MVGRRGQENASQAQFFVSFETAICNLGSVSFPMYL